MLIKILRLNRDQDSITYMTSTCFMRLDLLEAKRVFLGLDIMFCSTGEGGISVLSLEKVAVWTVIFSKITGVQT
jgi:hypothetical protein